MTDPGASAAPGTAPSEADGGLVDGGVPLEGVDASQPTAPDGVLVLPPVELSPDAGTAPIVELPSPAEPRDTVSADAPREQAAAEITVVGTRLARTAGSAHVIGTKQLERFEYDDPTAVLMQTPGLYVRTEDGVGLRPNIGLRGVNPDRSKKVTLLEDGVLFGPAPYSAPAAYYFPIITRVTKVRVIKGPSAIGYGPQTIAGAVDLITRPIPDELAAAADIAVGQYGYGKAHVYAGASTDRFGALVEGVRLQTNGFKELPSGADTGFARNEWMVKGRYVIDPDADERNELRLKLTYSDEISNESYLGLSDADFKQNPNRRYAASQLDRMDNHRTSAVLTHLFERGPNFSITTNAYRHDFHRTWRKVNDFPAGMSGRVDESVPQIFDALRRPDLYPDQVRALRGQWTGADGYSILIGPNQRDFTSAGVESRLRWDAKTGPVSHRLEAGVRYHYDRIERRHSQNRYRILGDELYPTNDPTEVTAFIREWTHAVALHLQYAVTAFDLTLTPGIRTELIRSVSRNRLRPAGSGSLADLATAERPAEQSNFVHAVLPGVGAFYSVYKGLGVFGGVYRGFSPPPPGAGDDVKSEKSTNYEAGARYTRGGTRFEAVYFYNDYQNLTDYCTQSSGCSSDAINTQYDAGSARIDGLELFAEQEAKIGAFVLPYSLAYTFTRGEFDRTFVSKDPIWGSVTKGDEIPYLPRHQLRAQVGVEHDFGGLNAALTYVAPMREEPGRGSLDGASTLATDRQFIVDLAGQAKIWGPLSVYFNIQNLFDAQYIVSRRPFGARPNAPRWTHVGLRATY